MWITRGQRSELQPDPQGPNVSCISVVEKAGCSRLDTADQGHTEAQLDHVLPQMVSLGTERFTSTLLGCQLDTPGKGELQLRHCFHQSGREGMAGSSIFLIADRCGRLWPGSHRRGRRK